MSVCFSKLSILGAAYILIISPSCSERKKQPLDQKPTDKSRISAPLCHSAVTIEDFFLLTLKHQSIKLVGQENVSGQRCNKYRLIHSKSIGRYKISYAWVSRKSGILLRVTAYDQLGNPLQQIQITDLKKRNGQLQPLRIRFDAINPETNKFEKTSYLKLRSKLK